MSTHEYASPDDAEQAFYAAFEAADLEAMMGIWAPSGAVVCVHPGGPRLDGREAVEKGWREIFANGPSLSFERRSLERFAGADTVVHCLVELIRHGPQERERATVPATNAYRRFEAGWFMVLHHGSPGTVQRPAATAQRLH